MKFFEKFQPLLIDVFGEVCYNVKMHKLYWTGTDGKAYSSEHETLDTLLSESEEHRKAGMRFVCSATEDPNQVGKPGVDVAKDYKWFKRRLDPDVPLGLERKSCEQRQKQG